MVTIPVEQQIIEKLRKLDEAQKRQVLDFVSTFEEAPRYMPEELVKMPLEERNRLVAAAFEAAKDEDFEIFEAYSEEDLDD